MKDSAIFFKNVSRHFGELKAVDDVMLEIADGEFFSMLGPSGSGKTTCLRMIAGFDRPTSGQIFHFSRDVSNLPPRAKPELIRLVSTADLYPTEGGVDQVEGV